MDSSFKTIPQIISERIKNIRTVFVFPTDVAQTSWINWAVKNPAESGTSAFNLDQFTAWDTFKSSYLKSADENLECIPAVMRKVFAEKIIFENNENPFLKKIISSSPELKKNAFGFTDWIAKILPSLKMWNTQYEQFYAKKNLPDEEDSDYKELFERYVSFLKENNFYEPAFLDAELKKSEKEFVIFYPEILEDFSEFLPALSRAENITIIHLPGQEKKQECILYENARQELRHLALHLRKLQLEGTDLRTVAVNVPDLESVRPYIERELSLYAVPYTIRAGIPYTKNCGGDIFVKIKECADSYFSYDSVRSLLLDGCIPWKNPAANEHLVREGKSKRCICCYEEKNILQDIWLLSLEDGGPEKELYTKLKDCVLKFKNAQSFQKLKFAWDRFKSIFIDEKKFKEPQYAVTDKILGRIITELNEFSSIEKKYFSRMRYSLRSPFDFFINEMQQKKYTPNEKKYGVNIFPYRLSVCADFEYQFIIDASQSSVSVPFKKLGFISSIEKRKLLGLEQNEKDASADFIQLYAFQQREQKKKSTFFSCSKESFGGFAIMHTSLQEKSCPENDFRPDSLDFITQEKNCMQENNPCGRTISTLQKKAFFTWKSVFEGSGNSCSPMSEHLKSKIDLFLYKEKNPVSEKMRISQTALKSYFSCPRKFIFSKILRLEEDTLNAGITKKYEIGTFIHKIIELVFSEFQKAEGSFKGTVPAVQPQNSQQLKTLVEEKFEDAKYHMGFSQSLLAVKVMESQKELICKTVLEFLMQFCTIPEDKSRCKHFAGYVIEGIESEREKESADGNFYFSGKIDCILSDPDNPDDFTIIDYKTGNTPSAKECTLNGTPAPVLHDFQIASYVKILEDEKKTVKSALFYRIKKDDKNEFKSVPVISEKPARGATDRNGFSAALSELESCASLFFENAQNYQFSPADFKQDKKYGIHIFKDCKECSFNTICRTTFSIARNNLN